MKVLAVIPARAGSKRLPNKNILELEGKPLIAWSIEAAKMSKYVTDIVVSTDGSKIAEVARDFGASVPFFRPEELSSDTASSVDAVKHCIEFYKNQLDKSYDYVLLLQPTSPFRLADDIDKAVELLRLKQADAVVSMCECEHSPLWANRLPEDASLDDFDKEEFKGLRSQDLPKYYRYNGAIYLTSVKRFLEEKSFNFKTKSYAYIMPQERSVDIDTALDFKLAELLLRERSESYDE